VAGLSAAPRSSPDPERLGRSGAPGHAGRTVVILAGAFHLMNMSLTHVLGRHVLAKEHVPPEIVVSLRCLVAAAVLVVSYLAFRPSPRGGPLQRREWVRLVLVMALGVPINQFFYILGLKYAPAVHGSLLFCTMPLVLSVLDAVFGGHRAPRGTWIGAGLALAGVFFVLEERGLQFETESLKGDGILSISVLAWSTLTLVSRPLLPRLAHFALARLTLLGGTLLLQPFTLGDLSRFDYATLSVRAILCILFLGVFTSVVAYINWYFLLSRIGAVRCGMLLTLQPITTAILAGFMLDEPITPQLVVGGVVVLAGLLMVQIAEARAKTPVLAEEPAPG
jgi:drug/metabolite transporter (DMT)-like permease